MHFYEIHEGDEEVGAAVLLAHDEQMDPFEFFELVKTARALVHESYEEDSLAEAIANELQRSGGFTHVTDSLLVASVNVDEKEENTYLLTEEGDTRTLFMKREENGEPQNGEDEEES
jgi:rRNA maturation protein Rpf1